MPMEYIIPGLRVAQITEMADTDTVNERLAQLLALEEDRFIAGVADFHTPRSRGRNIQATWCVLGGKSRVKAVTLFLTPSFRLNS